ncbi:tRNA uridine-5-carboxymethylaminomethyl(34) synthesis GTPase MnmE [bacterium]|nr:tRNA uridine-5-carboxymethylaminomethyl(34) synthesis GTPase MnmE [bacterium]
MHAPEATIAALATPPGEGALAVLRLSGPQARAALERLQRPDARPPQLRPRRLQRLRLVDGEGRPLDEVLAAWMPGPHSYTGEEVVEISTHGGPATVNAILEALFALGLKAAHAGEFTYRAFLNGRLDLVQAEAVAELIHSRSEGARRLALHQLSGSLSRRLAPLRAGLLGLLCDLEAGIDFAEEDIEFVSRETLAATIASLREEMGVLLAGAADGILLREGVSVALLGAPNVGKSSLFNALLGEERAIVTAEPGTTRDLLRESWQQSGLHFSLIDTAGLREPAAEAERQGVARSATAAATARLALWVCDGSRPPGADEAARLRSLRPGQELLVVNKADLPGFDAAPYTDLLPAGEIGLAVSALSGEGLPALRARLLELATGGRQQALLELEFALNRRQSARLRAAQAVLAGLDAATVAALEPELLARELREALAALDELSGRALGEAVLAEIFSRFCVGK